MSSKIKISLSEKSVGEAIKELRQYKKSLDMKMQELCRKLAEMGAVKVSLGYARAPYTGTKDISVSVEPIDKGYAIKASGESLLFVEFGAGVTHGYGHPQAAEFGYGPGTYPPINPNNPKWDNPKGWYIPGGEHTYGNAPSATMYQTAKELEEEVLRTAMEVFNS